MKNHLIVFVILFSSISTFSQKKWTLEECVSHALENNITIKENKLNLTNTELDVKNAKAVFLPTVSASTNSNLNFGSTIHPVSKDRVSTSNFGGSVGLSTGITLFNGYRNTTSYKLAQLGVESSKLNLDFIQNDLSLQVVNAFLNALFAKENIQISKNQKKLSEKQMQRIEEQYKAGVVPKIQLLNIKSTIANDNQNLTSAENRLSVSLLRLTQLLQLDDDNFDVQKLDVEKQTVVSMYKSYKDIYDQALTNRPEIKQEELNSQRADLNLKLSKSAYYPTVNASGRVGTNYGFNLDLPDGFSNTNFGKQLSNNLGYGIGVGVSIPIFSGYRNDVGVQKAKVSQNVASLRLENKKLQLKQKIQQAFLDADLARKTYEISKISVETQKESFKNAVLSLEYGTITVFDFDQVRNKLTRAESSLVNAKYDYIFKSKVLKFYFDNKL